MQKIIGYIRESTIEQVKDGYSMADQERRIRLYLDLYYKPGEYSFELFEEKGKSAKTLHRPQMKQIMGMAERQQFDTIIICALDRLTRNVADMDVLVKLFDKKNIEIVSVQENVDTHSAQGRFFIYLVSLIAQWEREIIIIRTRNGKRQSAMMGNYVKGTPPLGYKKSETEKGKLVVIPELAKSIVRIFNDVGERDIPVFAVAARMTNQRIAGRKWKEEQVRKILFKEEYYGTMVYENKAYPNQVPAIITKEQFDLAHQKMDGRHHVMRNRYVYKDRCYCELCHSKMTVTGSLKKKKKCYTYYYCTKCGRVVNQRDITEQLDKKLTKAMRQDMFETEIEKLQHKYSRAVTMLRRASYSYVTYGLTEAFYDSLIDSAETDANEIRTKIMAESARIDKIKFSECTYRDQREFVLEHVKKVELDVYDKKVTDLQFLEEKHRLDQSNENTELDCVAEV